MSTPIIPTTFTILTTPSTPTTPTPHPCHPHHPPHQSQGVCELPGGPACSLPLRICHGRNCLLPGENHRGMCPFR
ncbi:unnamed protein product [Closterium sp. NIES-53]